MQSESVESLVDKYINDWGFLPEKMEREIRLRWEMDESEKQKAYVWLKKHHSVNIIS